MTSESTENRLFDPAAIEKLRAVAGDQGATFVAEMAALFLDEATKSLEELKRDCAGGDWKHVTRIAHSLKSSSATLGLMRVSAACRALEMDTKGGAPSPQSATLAAAVLDEFEQARPTLESLS